MLRMHPSQRRALPLLRLVLALQTLTVVFGAGCSVGSAGIRDPSPVGLCFASGPLAFPDSLVCARRAADALASPETGAPRFITGYRVDIEGVLITIAFGPPASPIGGGGPLLSPARDNKGTPPRSRKARSCSRRKVSTR